MKTICLYFEIHQIIHLKRYRFFDIGTDHYYYDDYENERSITDIAERSYMPALTAIEQMIKEHGKYFKVAFSLSGVGMEQLRAVRRLVFNLRLVEEHLEGLPGEIDFDDSAHFAVEDLFFVVVLGLHHPVAEPEDPRRLAMEGEFRLVRGRGVEERLEPLVEGDGPAFAPAHRGEHLDVLQRGGD